MEAWDFAFLWEVQKIHSIYPIWIIATKFFDGIKIFLRISYDQTDKRCRMLTKVIIYVVTNDVILSKTWS
jgi:hypothetical protein